MALFTILIKGAKERAKGSHPNRETLWNMPLLDCILALPPYKMPTR